MLIEFKKVNDCFYCKYKWDCCDRRLRGDTQPCKTLMEIVDQVERYKRFLEH